MIRIAHKIWLPAAVAIISAIALCGIIGMVLTGSYSIVYQGWLGRIVLIRGLPSTAFDVALEGYLVVPLAVILIISLRDCHRISRHNDRK